MDLIERDMDTLRVLAVAYNYERIDTSTLKLLAGGIVQQYDPMVRPLLRAQVEEMLRATLTAFEGNGSAHYRK
jgi:hypothetical protein